MEAVEDVQSDLRPQVEKVQAVADTLDPTKGTQEERRAHFETIQEELSKEERPSSLHMAAIMASFVGGLFLGPIDELPRDNLELERWFRQPKGHERHIHGRCHAGTRIVREGPTLVPALDAHQHHLGPFTAAELAPYRSAQPPPSQRASVRNHAIMRRARSRKLRPILLADLEKRYLALPQNQ